MRSGLAGRRQVEHYDLALRHPQSENGLFVGPKTGNRGSFYSEFLLQLIAILAAPAKALPDFSTSYRVS
jgi:hypothetical protein